MQISNKAGIAAVNAMANLLDTGGYLEVRTGAMPANADAADSGTLLGTLTMSADAFAAAADAGDGGVEAEANTITSDTSADASGTIGHVRVKDSIDAVICDLTASVTGGGGDAQFDTLTVVAGGQINLTGWTLRLPKS